MSSALRATPEPFNATDVYIGQQLRHRRRALQLSQKAIAAALGITFQQVQKYERGINRICASRLQHICQILDVPMAYFFEDVAPLHAEQITDLLDTFNTLKYPADRQKLLDYAHALAASAQNCD